MEYNEEPLKTLSEWYHPAMPWRLMEAYVHEIRDSEYTHEAVELEIKDAQSRKVIFRCTFDLNQFTKLLVTRTHSPGLYAINAEYIGLRREHKTVPILYDPLRMNELLACEEVDGWQAIPDSYTNHYNRIKKEDDLWYSLTTFIRYVPEEDQRA